MSQAKSWIRFGVSAVIVGMLAFLGGSLLGDALMDVVLLKPKRTVQPPPTERGPIVINVGKNRIHNMGLRTATVKRGPFIKEIRTVAKIVTDETRTMIVNSKIDGWVEYLAVNYVGMRVKRGRPLLRIFSPKLILAQEEYLIAFRGRQRVAKSLGKNSQLYTELDGLLGNARRRLSYLDLSKWQIRSLERTLKTRRTLSIRSPFSGVVMVKQVHEGMFIKAGQPLMKVSDLSKVWAEVEVFETELPWIKLKQHISLTLPYLPGRAFEGVITYIEPFFKGKRRIVKVRVVIDNADGTLRPYMYGDALLHSVIRKSTILVPDLAVVREGPRTIVFVDRGKGEFEARDVVLNHNRSVDGYFEVLRGLHAGEQVVTSGLFLLDSARRLKESQRGTATTAPDKRPVDYYTCPMPEHAHVRLDKPGPCPECGMPLVAVYKQKTVYSCPMPSDWHIRKDQPGRCPLCGMKLVPTHTIKGYKIPKDAPPKPLHPRTPSTKDAGPFVCPMRSHWNVRSSVAGDCPLCSMKLVPQSTVKGYAFPKGKDKLIYSCPMELHWHVRLTVPGKCPLCGMSLENTQRIKGYKQKTTN